MTAVSEATRARTAVGEAAPRNKRPIRPARMLLYVFLTLVAVGWLLPILFAVYASLRAYAETSHYGYFSLPRHLTLHYYAQAWDVGLPKYYKNTYLIAVPSVLMILFFASFVAFAISRVRIRGAKFLLVLFTAGNLLPPQVMVTPLYTLYNNIPLPEALSQSS